MILRRGLRLLACLLVPLAASAPGARGAGPIGGSENIAVSLLAEQVAVRPGHPFQVGLLMTMDEGWHTYWKHPGDAGLPLRIEWTLPPGFSAGPIEWPTPEKVPTGGLMSYGYGREVLLPITITPPAIIAAESVTVAGQFDWLECKEACVPGGAALSLSLPVRGETELGSSSSRFAEARGRMPRAIALTMRPPAGVKPKGAYLFIDQPLIVEHAAPQGFERAGNGYRLTATPAENAPEPPSRVTGVLLLEGLPRGKGQAVLVDLPVVRGDPAPASTARKRSWPAVASWALLFVLVGLGVAWMRRGGRARSAR